MDHEHKPEEFRPIQTARGPKARLERLRKAERSHGKKVPTSMRLAPGLLAAFRELADAEGVGYQQLMQRALQEWLDGKRLGSHLESVVREAVREELRHASVAEDLGPQT